MTRSAEQPAFDPAAMFAAGDGAQTQNVNLFLFAHKLLRGRYALAFSLAVVGAVAGMLFGYTSQKPQYQVEGLVRFVQFPPILMNESLQTRPIANMQNYVATQASNLQSARVIAKAMDSQAWRALGRPAGSVGERLFKNSLLVNPNPRNSEEIIVAFSDVDPKAAKSGCMEVLQAYEDYIVEGELRRQREAGIRLMESELKSLDGEIDRLQKQMLAESREFGTTDLGNLLRTAGQELSDIERQLRDTRVELAKQGVDPDAASSAPDSEQSGKPQRELSPSEIAKLDEGMRDLLIEEARWEQEISDLLQRFTELHRDVKRARQFLGVTQGKIAERAKKFNAGELRAQPGRSSGPDRPNAAELLREFNVLKSEHVRVRDRVGRISEKNTILEGLRSELQAKKERRAIVEKNFQNTQSESQFLATTDGGRISIIKPDAVPDQPNVDRRMKFAAVGFLGGGMMPVVLVAMIGLLDGRLRYSYSDQARDDLRGLPMLGILPSLPRDLGDPEQAANAAHCVHHMRTLLQIGDGARKTYAVTSATAGDGKTSLTLSLAMSFAAAGSRVLLIDFDLVGHGLSSSLKIKAERGIAEALANGRFEDAIIPTGMEGLSIIPSGRDDDRYVSKLSEQAVKSLMAYGASTFDIVMVDTGPVLGSLEANYVCAVADGVVLVVGRGQSRSHVQRAIDSLASLRAKVMGVVFNRAEAADFLRSATSASFRSVRDEPPSPRVPASQIPDLEPVARTVAMDTRR